MKRKISFLLAILMVLSVQAAPVSRDAAARAASTWAAAGTLMGLKLNTSVSSVTSFAVTNGYSFYAVKLQDSGTVFMTSDTEMDPVIGFSAKSELDLAKGSPLRMLLDGDIAWRAARLAGGTANSSATAAAVSAWTCLQSDTGKTLNAADPQLSVDDVRVAPLLSTKWSQQEAATGVNCYNYYTPYNWPCGCTATALSQTLKYYRYPNTEQSAVTRKCTYQQLTMSKAASTNLTTIAGAYAWDLMVDEPDGDTPEDSLQAIGRLTYNVGVLLGSKYTPTETTGIPTDVVKVMRDDLGFASAVCFWSSSNWNKQEGGLHSLAIREKIIYANLDAHLPVQLAIYGYADGHDGESAAWGGHAVVADGYGYKQINEETVAFVHVNLGWAGKDDLWYNIPAIHTGTGIIPGGSAYNFDYLGAATFNAMTNTVGEILSGRVLDIDEQPVAGASVKAVNLATGSVAGETVSDEYGVYALVLEGGVTYRLIATSADGKVVIVRDADVTLGNTAASDDYVVDTEGKLGNRWGNDIILEASTVRIGATEYVTLDSALEAAKLLVAEQPELKPEIEIFAPTRYRQTVSVNFPCTIRAVGAEAEDLAITRFEGAVLDVVENGALALSNVVFTAAATNVVSVAEGGVVKLGQGVDFGMASDQVAVRTAAADGLELVDEITSGFMIDAQSATETDQVFGTFSCDFALVESSANLIANYYDEYGEIRGVAEEANGNLVWKDVPVPLSEAVGYFIDTDAKTNTYARMDRVFEKFAKAIEAQRLPANAELVLLKDGTLTRSLRLTGDVIIRGEGGVKLADLGPQAGFVVNGGTLRVRRITFDGFTGNALFQVNGGNLEMSNCELYNLNGTNAYSGAVQLLAGAVRTKDTVFGSCRATGKYSNTKTLNAMGGAIYLNGANCSLALIDTTITNCWAKYLGGGIYAKNGSAISFGGNTKVKGNSSAVKNTVDDVYCKSATLSVEGLMVADDPQIGLKFYATAARQLGSVFATIDAGVLSSDPVARQAEYAMICNCFFNDTDASQAVGDPDAQGTCARLAWCVAAGEDHTDPTDAACYLSGRGDEFDGYYRRTVDAFRAAPAEAKILLLKNDAFASEVLVSNRVTLVSTNAAPCQFSRNGEYSITVLAGGELTVSNVCVRGCKEGTASQYSVPLLAVNGGKLTFASGAKATEVWGVNRRDANAVTVWNGGEFTMLSGSVIECCKNEYSASAGDRASGGGLLVDGGKARLLGGIIRDCYATKDMGTMISSYSEVEIAGDFTICENSEPCENAATNMLTVSVNSSLYLSGPFSGKVRYQEGLLGSAFEFGQVTWQTSDLKSVNAAAQCFYHGDTADRGTVATNATSVILVWNSAVAADGTYTSAQGLRYFAPYAEPVEEESTPDEPTPDEPTPDEPEVVEPQSFSVTFTKDDAGNIHVVCDPVTEGCWYSLWAAESLTDEFQQVGESRQLGAANGNEFVVEAATGTGSRFYKVKAEAGTR